MRTLRFISRCSVLLLLGGLVSCTAFGTESPDTKPLSESGKPASRGEATSASPESKLAPPAEAGESKPRAPLPIRRADYAITKINLERADEFLEGRVGPDAARARARLAIYRADCEGALAHLASTSAKKAKGAARLLDLAQRCHGATAGGIIIDDKKNGVWLRLQDEADRTLAPLLIRVAAQARAALERDLGVDLPRPLKIDLVRDLFSLSAVSGLPLESAETTGTVAVARWGRVTMVSPRAMTRGFPWADTLAHEITHLLLSRATADRAPLWLQEGVAKREEHRWREEQPFDDLTDFGQIAFEAERDGKSVGIDAIGPSIAMLPSAEAASIAFAEVTSFMDFWIETNGPRSLGLLLRELEIAADDDQAMRGVSGYSLGEWQRLYRRHLRLRYARPEQSEIKEPQERLGARAMARALRLTELLTLEGYPGEAVTRLASDMDRGMHSAAFRFFAGRASLLSDGDTAALLGSLEGVEFPHAGFLALASAEIEKSKSSAEAHSLLQTAIGLDPLLPEVACAGVPWVGKETTGEGDSAPSPPELDPETQELCDQARTMPVRGSR